jgi:hypothetical protein
MVVRPGDSVQLAKRGTNYHSKSRLLKLMVDEHHLAVFNTRTVNAAGVPSDVRVAYGPTRIWPSKGSLACTVHMNMEHAVANAWRFTSVHPNGNTGRVPSKHRRDQTVKVLGADYDVKALDDNRAESDRDYDGQSDDDCSDTSV